MLDQAPIQLSLPGFPVPALGLQQLADAQRAFIAAFEQYQRLLSERNFEVLAHG